MIYKLLLPDRVFMADGRCPHVKLVTGNGLLYSNRQIHNEFVPVVFSQIRFMVSWHYLDTFIGYVGFDRRQHITKLTLARKTPTMLTEQDNYIARSVQIGCLTTSEWPNLRSLKLEVGLCYVDFRKDYPDIWQLPDMSEEVEELRKILVDERCLRVEFAWDKPERHCPIFGQGRYQERLHIERALLSKLVGDPVSTPPIDE